MLLVMVVRLSKVPVEFECDEDAAQPESFPDIVHMTSPGRLIANFHAFSLELCWRNAQLACYDFVLTQLEQLSLKLLPFSTPWWLTYEVLWNVLAEDDPSKPDWKSGQWPWTGGFDTSCNLLTVS